MLPILLVVSGAGALVWFSARGQQPSSPGLPTAGPASRALRIGVLYWSETIEGQRAMRRGVEAEARALAPDGGLELVPLVAGDGPEGQRRQLEQMRQLLALGVDGILVQPTDTLVLGPALREANDAGVPVVAYDQYIEGGALTAFVTSDNRQAGRLGGEYVAHRRPGDAPLKLVVVEYPQVSSTVERLDGFFEALRERGRAFTLLKTYEAVEPVAGAKVGAKVLAAFPQPGSIDVIFSVNDGAGLSVVDALADAGRTEILVATVDGDPRSVENIRAGRLTGIDAAQFCGPLGATALRTLVRVLRGEDVPRLQLVPTFPITKETLDRYPGWDGPLPAAFPLPWPGRTDTWAPTLQERSR